MRRSSSLARGRFRLAARRVSFGHVDRTRRWQELGESLPLLIAEAEAETARVLCDHLALVLSLCGVTQEGLSADSVPDVRGPDFALSVLSGSLGDHVRGVAERAAILRDVGRLWQSTHDEEVDEPWSAFWEGIQELLPPLPEDALDAVAGLPQTARAVVADAGCTWPVVVTDRSEAEVVGQALDELSRRSGIARTDLPSVPALPDRPLMSRDGLADVVAEAHDWVLSREAWGRVLGRLAPWLCAP